MFIDLTEFNGKVYMLGHILNKNNLNIKFENYNFGFHN